MKKNRVSVFLILLWFALSASLTGGRNAILIAVCIAIPLLFSFIYYVRLPKQMKCRLRMPAYVRKKENVKGNLLVKRGGEFPVFHAQAFFAITNLMTGEKEEFTLNVSMMRKREESSSFDFSPRYAGILTVTLEKIEIYGLLGCLKKTITIEKSREIMVLPNTFEMNLKLRPIYCMNEEGEKTMMSRNGYDASVYHGVREFREGDSIKHIHWKLTGKADEYVVKELGVPAIMRPVLYMETNVQKQNPAMVDAMVEVYISLSQQMVQEGYQHILCWYDHRKNEWIWHDVRELEQLEEAFDLLLRTPFIPSTEANFFAIPSAEWENYGQVVIVSNQKKDFDSVMNRVGSVTLLIGKEKRDRALRDDFVYPFGITTVYKDLYLLEL